MPSKVPPFSAPSSTGSAVRIQSVQQDLRHPGQEFHSHVADLHRNTDEYHPKLQQSGHLELMNTLSLVESASGKSCRKMTGRSIKREPAFVWLISRHLYLAGWTER